MKKDQVYWSKATGRNNARHGSNINLVTTQYNDALGNVLTRLFETDHEILFCSDQKRYNGYMRSATRKAMINIQQERQYESPECDMGQMPEPYIDMVSSSWVDDVEMSEDNRAILKLYFDGYNMREIGEQFNLTESAISYRLTNIVSVLQNYYPDMIETSRPCSFGAYVQEAKTYKRVKKGNEFVAWPVSKEKGHRIGKTRAEYQAQTKQTVCLNLNASCPLPPDYYTFEYNLCDNVPLGVPTVPKAREESKDKASYVIAERKASRTPGYCLSRVHEVNNNNVVDLSA